MNKETAELLAFLDGGTTLQQEVVKDQGEAECIAEVVQQWEELLPKNNFGILDAVGVPAAYRTMFKKTLEQNYQQKITEFQPAAPLYTIHQDSATAPASVQEVIALHMPQQLAAYHHKLNAFLHMLEGAQIPAAVKEAYAEKATAWLQFCETGQVIGTPEFTNAAGSPRLSVLLDLEKTQQRGEVTLQYEDAARTVLELSQATQKEDIHKTDSFQNYFRLTDAELAPLSLERLSSDEPLQPQETKHLYTVFLKRLGIADSWNVIIDASVATTVNAKAKVIRIPESETYDPTEIELFVSHEFVHIIRGENGSRQSVTLLQEGTEGYETTDEGLAVLAELLAGELFGHERQAKMAARYYAIALCLKTAADVDGTVKAKHSLQDIYTQLREYGIPEQDAGDILWRIQRGTTLNHQAVPVTISQAGTAHTLLVAETFPKDTIYFEGQMALFDFFKRMLPLENNDRTHPHIEATRDFNVQYITKIGKAIARTFLGSQVDQDPAHTEKLHDYLEELGRDAILDLLDYFMIGKIPFEKVTDPQSPWHAVLERATMVSYRSLFNPVEADATH